VINSLAVLAAAALAGADLALAALALAQLQPAAGRGSRIALEGPDGAALLIDESYNANPASMRAALALLAQAPVVGRGRRIAVLGDMLELGPEDLWWHRDAGRYAAARTDRLVCVGSRARAIGEGAVETGLSADSVSFVDSPEEAALLLDPLLASGDAVLFKASRGIGLDRAVAKLARTGRRDSGSAGRVAR
jgi:UDP-N-acetylmuramoyl-tripeptide--D-alanyl-D-alanine ligase